MLNCEETKSSTLSPLDILLLYTSMQKTIAQPVGHISVLWLGNTTKYQHCVSPQRYSRKSYLFLFHPLSSGELKRTMEDYKTDLAWHVHKRSNFSMVSHNWCESVCSRITFRKNPLLCQSGNWYISERPIFCLIFPFTLLQSYGNKWKLLKEIKLSCFFFWQHFFKGYTLFQLFSKRQLWNFITCEPRLKKIPPLSLQFSLSKMSSKLVFLLFVSIQYNSTINCLHFSFLT